VPPTRDSRKRLRLWSLWGCETDSAGHGPPSIDVSEGARNHSPRHMTERHHAGENGDDPGLDDVVSDAESISTADTILDELDAAMPDGQNAGK